MTTVDDAVVALESGFPIVVPTDTVYGLAVDPSRPGATARLFAIKERPREAALPVLAADPEQAFALCGDVPASARLLADRFWPGGLTLVVPRRAGLGYDLGGIDDATIGVRVPDHELIQVLARRVGPLAATSANLHGQPTRETAQEVADALAGAAPLVLDGGRCEGAPSTVVSCTPDGGVHVLRAGRIPAVEIEAVVRP